MEGISTSTSFHGRKSDLASLPKMFSSQHCSTLQQQQNSNDVNTTEKQNITRSICDVTLRSPSTGVIIDIDKNDDTNSTYRDESCWYYTVIKSSHPRPFFQTSQTSGTTNTSMPSHTTTQYTETSSMNKTNYWIPPAVTTAAGPYLKFIG